MNNYFNYAQLYNLNLLNFIDSSLTVNFTDVPTYLNNTYDSIYSQQSMIFETQFTKESFSERYFSFTNELLFDNITDIILNESIRDSISLISDSNVRKVLNFTQNPGLVPLFSLGLANLNVQVLQIFKKMRNAASNIDDVDRLLKTFGSPR